MISPYKRVALFSDPYGAPTTLELLEPGNIACLVVASIRPGQFVELAPFAKSHGIPVLVQPRRSDAEYPAFVSEFKRFDADLVLCNSYSMLIGSELLEIVGRNAFNVHSALLPKNRGPNPIQWALIRGEDVTGVTIHYMVAELDAGDIVAQRSIAIDEADTWVTLRDRLEVVTKELLVETLPKIMAGTNERKPQDHAAMTSNSRLNADSPQINFLTMSDRQVFNLIRAQVRPLAGAFVETDTGRVRFQEMVPLEDVAAIRRQFAPLEVSAGKAGR